MKFTRPLNRTIFLFVVVLLNSSAFADSLPTDLPDKAFDLNGIATQTGEDANKKEPDTNEANVKTDTNTTDNAFDLSRLAAQVGKEASKKNPGISEADIKAALERKSETAAMIAATYYPENSPERETAEKVYNLSLFMHQQSEISLGLPKNDFYGAIAAFMYGNWSSYHNGKIVSDEYLPTVHKEIIRLFPGLGKVNNAKSEAEKKKAYEYFAIKGNWMVLMQIILKQNPNAEYSQALKSLAIKNFNEMQIKPEKFNISDKGLVTLSN